MSSEKLRTDVIESERIHLIEWLRSDLQGESKWISLITVGVFLVSTPVALFAFFSIFTGNALQVMRALLSGSVLLSGLGAALLSGGLVMYRLRREKRELAGILSRMASVIDKGAFADVDSATAKKVVTDADVAQVIDRAADVIGNRDEALRWLGTPVRALACATPVSLLATPEGRNQVLTVLDRLEHGVL